MPTVSTFDSLISGSSWNGIDVSGRPVFLTYSFDTTPASYLAFDLPRGFLDTFRAFDAAQQALARQALAAWADASGITFFEVPAGLGDLRFGAYDFNVAPEDFQESTGFAYYPVVYDFADGAFEDVIGGDIFIAHGEIDFGTLAHEIGHALGLKHPFEDGVVLDPALDDLAHTVMTYNEAGGPATGLGSFDIEAIRFLYGASDRDGTQVPVWSWDPVRLVLSQAGGDAAESLAGVAVSDSISGGGGNDYVMARGGDDILDGGAGADTLSGGDDADTISGGQGNDELNGDAGADSVSGGEGNDDLWGMSGADILDGGEGSDTLHGGSGMNRLTAGGGNDLIYSDSGADLIDGGEGVDALLYFLPGAAGASFGYGVFGRAGGVFSGVEIIGLIGGPGGDTVTGGDLRDILTGDAGSDSLVGGGNDDLLFGETGNDTISAGSGNDAIDGGGGSNYLRGDEGDDEIFGGANFDDINGNMGDDSANGGRGDDWVVGGKGNDLLFGDVGNDLVYGNLGSDTCDGGAGADIVRGGQGNDSLSGGAGDDFLSGDRGDDTMTGGLGADRFSTFGEAGLDRVLDFNVAEGDRVQLLPGTAYTALQVGDDTVITMEGGGQMVLVGVFLSGLPNGWIFGA